MGVSFSSALLALEGEESRSGEQGLMAVSMTERIQGDSSFYCSRGKVYKGS